MVVPLTMSAYTLLQHNLLNTGVTRAKRLVVLAAGRGSRWRRLGGGSSVAGTNRARGQSAWPWPLDTCLDQSALTWKGSAIFGRPGFSALPSPVPRFR